MCDLTKANCVNRFFIDTVQNLKQQIAIYPDDAFNLFRTVFTLQLHFNLNYIVAGDLENVILNLKEKSSGNDNITATVITTVQQILL